MKVFLTRPNHLLRAPTMAHCYDSRRALPHRERRTTAQPLLNCVLISATANIRMRRQRTGVRWGESTCGCPTSTLRSCRFFLASTGVLLLPPGLTLESRPSSPEGFFLLLPQKLCACVWIWTCDGKPSKREGLSHPAGLIDWLVGWVEGWIGLIQSRDGDIFYFLLLPSAKVPIYYSPSQDPNMFTITYLHYCCCHDSIHTCSIFNSKHGFLSLAAFPWQSFGK